MSRGYAKDGADNLGDDVGRDVRPRDVAAYRQRYCHYGIEVRTGPRAKRNDERREGTARSKRIGEEREGVVAL